MAQRVLAENAGVMSVRYVLPNKHYIPVDMKYIGVDNTTPYVAISLWDCVLVCELIRGAKPFWDMSSASCCGAEDDGARRGWLLFSIDAIFSCPLSPPTRVLGQLTHPHFSCAPDATQRSSPQWTHQGKKCAGYHGCRAGDS
jgi:hypothetical protein